MAVDPPPPSALRALAFACDKKGRDVNPKDTNAEGCQVQSTVVYGILLTLCSAGSE
jgi:hypothetical protein